MSTSYPIRAQAGTSLLEVLVTIVIVALGLLGLAGLQSRMQSSEMEAYQRAQALVLLNDMASRIAVNRGEANDYVAAVPFPDGTCPASTASRADMDVSAWCNALKGAGEVSGGTQVGAMVGGRGCVESLPNDEYMITVAWQGLTPVSAPPVSVGCGAGDYDGGAGCIGDLCRRVVTTIVRIATLN